MPGKPHWAATGLRNICRVVSADIDFLPVEMWPQACFSAEHNGEQVEQTQYREKTRSAKRCHNSFPSGNIGQGAPAFVAIMAS
jgi:hypothetical protein